jgi:hypothetical protein
VSFTLRPALDRIVRPGPGATTGQKRQYSDDLSREFSSALSDSMVTHFPQTRSGEGLGVMAASAAGLKSVDVGFHVLGAGLAVGISVKCIGLAEPGHGFTHNYKRVSEEWTLETVNYHRYQPYSIILGVLFLPTEAMEDRGRKTSFVRALEHFRLMSGRESVHFDPDVMERVLIGVYERDDVRRRGDVFFVDVANELSPRALPPIEMRLSFETVKDELVWAFRRRNPRLRVEGMPTTPGAI